MTDIARAEAIVIELMRKRRVAVQRGRELQDERAAVALAAQRYEPEARSRLGEINQALALLDTELRNTDAALSEASRVLAIVQGQEQKEIA